MMLTRVTLLSSLLFSVILGMPAQVQAQLIFEEKEPQKEEREERGEDDDDDEEGDAPPRCEDGRVATAYTEFHCCWPGQAWNGEACVGLPESCPEGFEVDVNGQSCALDCPEGLAPTAQGDHCCWPGQAWNGDACVGMPTTCPEGFVGSAEEQACVKDCPAGRVESNGHCCWPGQLYVNEQCGGVPSSCPAGYVVQGQTCAGVDEDGDAILDLNDACPSLPEDVDGFEDEDGCPEPDNDGDGLCDDSIAPELLGLITDPGCAGFDACPLDAEDYDRYEDEDGCPEAATLEAALPPPETPPPVAEESDHTAAWVMLALGATFTAVGAGLISYGESETTRLEGLVDDSQDTGAAITSLTQAEAQEGWRQADNMLIVGAIMVPLSAGLMAYGIALFFDDEESAATISGSVGRDHVTLGLSGRF